MRRKDATLVVAGRIAADARRTLTDAGVSWLDLRGRLHLRAPGLRVDTDVSAAPSSGAVADGPAIRGLSGLSVAYGLSSHPGEVFSPTHASPTLGLAPSSLSVALRHLSDAGLATSGRVGVQPELFWELAAQWRPRRAWLATAPHADEHRDADGRTTWALGGDQAALAAGAPIVTTGNGPVELYVPHAAAANLAVRRCGSAAPGGAVASLAVAPTRQTILDAIPGPAGGWDRAPVLTVALDLAADPGRGSEIVRDWQGGPDHVWADS